VEQDPATLIQLKRAGLCLVIDKKVWLDVVEMNSSTQWVHKHT